MTTTVNHLAFCSNQASGSWPLELSPNVKQAVVFQLRREGRRHLLVLTHSKKAVTAPPAPPLPTPTTAALAPTLQHIEREDLTDIQPVLMLYNQAVYQFLIGSSEAARLTIVALAQHVLSCRPKNEGGLFRHLLKQKRYHYVTQADEDAALPRLKQHLYGRD